MKNLEKTIWIEAERWSEGQWDIEDMVLIDIGSKERICEVIDDLLKNDEFEQAFSRGLDE